MTRSRRLLVSSATLLAITMYGLAMPKAAQAASTICGSVCVWECSNNACDYQTQGVCPTMVQCGAPGSGPTCGGTAPYEAICVE